MIPTGLSQLFSSAGGFVWVASAMPGPFVLHSQAGPWANHGVAPTATQQLTSLGWWELLRRGLLNWAAGDSSFFPC